MHKSWALCLPLFALGSDPAFAVNTLKDWDGQQFVEQFGCPDTQTYGQVISVRRTVHHLNKFAFELANGELFGPDPRSMVVRGEVYAWDGSKAAGPALYESNPRTISYPYDDLNFHKETFRPSMLSLLPGKYIVFLSIAKDYQQCGSPAFGYELKWGAVDGSAYNGGSFYYQNDTGYGASAWTTFPWAATHGDLAFTADLTP